MAGLPGRKAGRYLLTKLEQGAKPAGKRKLHYLKLEL
jgi:hypothetical protein